MKVTAAATVVYSPAVFSDDVDEDDDFEDHDVDVDDDEDTLISSHNPLRTSLDLNKNHITSVNYLF
ncbi:hypothetical protein Hdeb2414_s0010g00354531 [Helianthus debilis subsp. tardiflorus]